MSWDIFDGMLTHGKVMLAQLVVAQAENAIHRHSGRSVETEAAAAHAASEIYAMGSREKVAWTEQRGCACFP